MEEFFSPFFTSWPSNRGVRAKRDDFSAQKSVVIVRLPGGCTSSMFSRVNAPRAGTRPRRVTTAGKYSQELPRVYWCNHERQLAQSWPGFKLRTHKEEWRLEIISTVKTWWHDWWGQVVPTFKGALQDHLNGHFARFSLQKFSSCLFWLGLKLLVGFCVCATVINVGCAQCPLRWSCRALTCPPTTCCAVAVALSPLCRTYVRWGGSPCDRKELVVLVVACVGAGASMQHWCCLWGGNYPFYNAITLL